LDEKLLREVRQDILGKRDLVDPQTGKEQEICSELPGTEMRFQSGLHGGFSET
jgi:hypothetical protein